MSTVVKTFERAIIDGHPAQQWRIMFMDPGYMAEDFIDIEKLSATERAEYLADEATIPPDPYPENHPDGRHRFPTAALAEEWAALMDSCHNLSAEIAAYGAPEECYSLAIRSRTERRKALEEQALESPYAIDGYNVEFMGAAPPKMGEEY